MTTLSEQPPTRKSGEGPRQSREKAKFLRDGRWNLTNTREKNPFLHLELTKSLGIIAFIKKLILNVDILHFSK
jgi:hypothetical protein